MVATRLGGRDRAARFGCAVSVLDDIVARKRQEVIRRLRHRRPGVQPATVDQRAFVLAALRRVHGAAPRAIAEIKFRSPSAGVIRRRDVGAVQRLALAYQQAGAAALSVLCDGPGFGGGVLDLRRAARLVRLPVLFKEFVVDPCQVSLARAVGAHLVLLLARVLDTTALAALVAEVRRQGLVPLVEAADGEELAAALRSGADLIGVNARDLRTFSVDGDLACGLVEQIPSDRVAIYMSGIATPEDLRRVANGRADAVLIGEGLMRAHDPGARLAELLSGA